MLVPITGFSLLNVVVKLSALSAVVFAFYRLWLGVAIMLATLVATRRRPTWATLKVSLPAGALFGLNIVLFFAALKKTSVTDVLIIASLQPALTFLVAGPLFGERVGVHEVAWTGASLVGIVLVTVGSSGTPAWSLGGDLLAVGALLAWTVYFLISKRLRQRMSAVEYMAGVTVGAAVAVTPVALLSGDPFGGVPGADWVWLGLFALGAQGGHVLIAWAHAHVDVSVSSLLILAEPPTSAVAALVFLGEPIPALSALGGLVVLVAVGAVIRRATRAGRRADLGADPDIAPT